MSANQVNAEKNGKNGDANPPAEEIRQDLSCLMDGELEDSQALFLLRRLIHDDELKSDWANWHRNKDAMAERCAADLTGFSDRMAAAISAEPAPVVPAISATPKVAVARFLKPIAGLGVAAAVAALAINLAPRQDAEQIPATLANATVASTAVEEFVDKTPTREIDLPVRSVSSGFTESARMQEYLLRHNQASPTRRGQGLVPFIYVIPDDQLGSLPMEESVDEQDQTESTTSAPAQP